MKAILIILMFFTTAAEAQKVDLTRLKKELDAVVVKLERSQADSLARIRKQHETDLARVRKQITDSIGALALIIVGEVPTGVVDGKNKVFYIGKPVPNSEAVYITFPDDRTKRCKRSVDGKGDYTIASTGRIFFAVAPPAGAVVQVDSYK